MEKERAIKLETEHFEIIKKQIEQIEAQRLKSKKSEIAKQRRYETNQQTIKKLKEEKNILQVRVQELENENNKLQLITKNLLELYEQQKYNKEKSKKETIAKNKEYKNFRQKILQRDNFTCQECGSKNRLQVHHIQSRKLRPDLIMDENNCITLCIVCHAKTDTYFS